ncbi:penicillin-binding protein 2 [Candidatus Berkelbacteria bacterium]|nr:penicillin-binding protein 2 [Candidatus Berkelbacteria bacterium]
MAKIDRIFTIYTLLFFAGGLYMFFLFEKQVLDHKSYASKAEEQSISTSATPAQRGQILAKDRDGKYYSLAASEWQYSLLITPRSVKDKKKLLELLKEDLPQLNIEEVYSKINNDKVYVPAILDNLTTETASKIKEKDYRGVTLQPRVVRVYPEADKIAAQIMGFVGADGKGKYGVEAIYDNELSGKSGSETVRNDAFGKLISILGVRDSVNGNDIVLTIDYNLQYVVEQELLKTIKDFKAERGSVLVMDPKTGAIIAAASQPTFDPNNYNKLSGEEQSRFLLSAASNIYEPGSVIKPITMSMALNEKLVKSDTQHNAGAEVEVLGYKITNAEDKAFGNETMTEVLVNSDNVQMVWVSSLIGAKKEREYFEKFGLGSKTNIDIIGEQSGRLPPEKEWNDLLRSTAAFGQGISATVVQLAKMYSTLANGGISVNPYIVQSTIQNGKEIVIERKTSGEQIISKEVSAEIKQMLKAVIENFGKKRVSVPGVTVAGKTGTAQIPSPDGGYYKNKYIGTFAGFFPVEDPKYVMVVRIDSPKTAQFASAFVAPTFERIANWMANYYKLR